MKFGEAIAIVGLGGIFPGASSLADFWNIIATGRDTSRSVPQGRWRLNPADILHPTPGTPDRVYTDRACFIEDFSLNPAGLNLDPELLASLDPSAQLLLAAGRDAFATAKTASLDKSRVGIVVGHIALPTESASRLCEEILSPLLERETFGSSRAPGLQTHPLNRYVVGMPAGLLAQALGLGGGTRTLDAACASSLYSLKLACDELHAERCDAMLAGGVSRPDSLYTQMGFAQLRALATSGRCTPFDAAASGLIVGEGAGVVVLKRVSDAIRDGDEIHALIRGIGLSNDLDGNLLSPASEGQLRALRLAYASAEWEPESVELIECHATGTPVGDAVEFSSLSQLWSDRPWTPGQCALGAVKANIGHLLTGAGAAGLLKVLLSLRHNTLPPVANFKQASSQIPLANSPFRALTESRPWLKRSDGRPRRAALNGFGFGGINAHVLIEEWAGKPGGRASKSRAVSGFGLPTASEPPPPVAIVGLGVQVGPWKNLGAFAARVLGAETELQPERRSTWRGLPTEGENREPQSRGGAHPGGYFAEDLEIPVNRYRIPPRELAELLPQQALMLEVAREAFHDAGVSSPQPTRTGVFVGLGLDLRTTDFHFRWAMIDRVAEWADRLSHDVGEQEQADWAAHLVEASGPSLNADRTMGALAGTNASRIAKEFRIGGQSYTVCNEDNSGLSAVEIAVRSLQRRELDLALAGGVELNSDLRVQVAEAAMHQSEVPAEGAVAVVLKRLDEAERDGDRIYAVIRGIGSASAEVDSRVQAFDRTPSGASQGQPVLARTRSAKDLAEARACAEAGLPHTPVLDNAAGAVGFAGAASGVADLAKAALALHTAVRPPTPGAAPQHWVRDRSDGLRRAAITGLSVDGNATSVLLEAHEAVSSSPDASARAVAPGHVDLELSQRRLMTLASRRPEGLFTFAAADLAGLLQQMEMLRADLDAPSQAPIDSWARRWYARNGRATSSHAAGEGVAQPFTLALIAQDRAQLLRLLDAARTLCQGSRNGRAGVSLDHHDRDRLFFTPPDRRLTGKVAFVFPGAGNHFADMGRELALLFPEVMQAQDRENERLASQMFSAQFWNTDAPVRDQRASICGQVALGSFVSDVALSLGLRPDAAIGYSLGESTSLFALRAWTARDEMLARVTASTLFTKDLTGEPEALRRAWGLSAEHSALWLAGLVDRPVEEVRAVVSRFPRTYILIVNTPRECVIGGDAEQVRALVSRLGCHFFALEGVSTVHCDLLKPVVEPYRQLHRFPTTAPSGVTFYSGGWGRSYVPECDLAAEAIVAQASGTIDFPKVVRAAYGEGVRFFVEMGPGASCSRMISQILDGQPHMARSLCISAKEPWLDVLRVLGHLWAEGLPLRLSSLYGVAVEEPPADAMGKTVRIPIAGIPMLPPPLPTGRLLPPPLAPVSVSVDMDPLEAELLSAMEQSQAAMLKAHQAYLAFSQGVSESLSKAVQTQLDLLKRAMHGEPVSLSAAPMRERELSGGLPTLAPARSVATTEWAAAQSPQSPDGIPRALNREQCMEFAIGQLGQVLGASFAEADGFPTRVRLPDEPLMLVDRITAIEGEPHSMSHGRVITEHDIHPGAWYLDCGRIPTCIAVEAGQADLFLSGFLGIDAQTRGLSMYRLLDAKVCFHRSLPGPGEVIRYDIRIERFFQQSGVWLFKFNFQSTVNGQPLLTMTEGCAGFFSQQDLEAGKGVVRTTLQLKPQPGKRPADWADFVPMAVESYSAEQLDALRSGDLAGCFGDAFAGLGLQRPVTLPSGRMRLVHRIERLEPSGGRFGLGLIRGEADIHPKDWFLVCHFVDDRVMPGTLMYECCLHTLRVHLLRLGWVVESRPGVALEPVPGVVGQLKCRGQVLETTKRVTYEIEIKEIGYGPEPYVIADALMYADGKAIVEIGNMSLRYSGVTREELQATWSAQKGQRSMAKAHRNGDVIEMSPVQAKPVLYGPERIRAFAVGNPSEAFGAPYRIFDADAPRRIARLPGPPYQFLDRITDIQGCEAFKMIAGGVVEAEYDVPAEEWYFAANRQGDMPFAVLLEIALQPCGWLSAYIGSALTSDEDLSYRNLGGSGTQFAPVRPGVGTLTVRVKNTRLSSSAGMIIQWFDFEVHAGREQIYKGDTYFGFFPKAALEKQEGIKGAKLYAPTASELEQGSGCSFPGDAPFADTQMRMVDAITLYAPEGGPAKLGFVRGTKQVNPEEWFFKAHFYQDPVVPGSLGLESFLQLLKFAAVKRWGHAPSTRWEAVAMNTRHEWVYRGQIIPRDALVTVEATITRVEDASRTLMADGLLSVDGRVIYAMKNFVVRGVLE